MQAERIYNAAFTENGGGDESDVAADFDASVATLSRWFTCEREVTGWYVSQRARIELKRPRIDRILLPTRELRNDCGWDLGPIGIEMKRRSEKIGRAVSQALDYSHAVFPVCGWVTCMLEWVFIWPVASVTGDWASVMVQNRIGWASYDFESFILAAGGMNVLRADSSTATFHKPKCGYKVGSR